MTEQDSALQKRAHELYVRASREVDPTTAGRLRAARRTALEARHITHVRRLLMPAGAFAVAALATFVTWQPAQHSVPTAISTSVQSADADGDLPPDADNTDPALYQNLEFYGWLASNSGSHASR
ncbi:MAG TPA: hypothetical protein VGO76_18050 [Luteibacter sp.]|nr:hypothetical protein [Luteibacter sp.]